MPNNEMDYSLIHRTPDGTGKILVTTPGSPDKGSWETEAELKTYVNQDVNAAINAVNTRVTNIEETLMGENEITVQYPDDGNYSSLMPNRVPARALKFAEVPRFRGKTRAWNSLGKAQTSGSAITRINDYSVSVSFDSSFSGYTQINEAVQTVNGHKYLVYYKQTSGTNLRTAADGIFKYYDASTIEAGNAYIADGDGTTDILQVAPYTEGVGGSGTFYSIVRDITLYFGGTLPADGDTVEKLQANYPELFVLSAYNAGSLVSTTVNGVESVGVNIWDEDFQNGYFYNATNNGAKESSVNWNCSRNKQPCVGGTDYYLYVKNKATFLIHVIWFDADNNYITYVGKSTAGVISSPVNACFFAMNIAVEEYGGTTYNHDIQICLNSYADKTTHHPYKTDTITLPTPVTLRSAGSVADTDELNFEVDGVQRRRNTQKISSYVFNGATDVSSSSTAWMANCYSFRISTAKSLELDAKVTVNSLCSNYIINMTPDSVVGSFWLYKDAEGLVIYINHDNNTMGIAAFRALLQSNPITFNFTRETPVVTLGDPILDPFIEVEGGGTMETIQEQTPVIDNCLDVTYDIIPQ